MIGCDSCDNWFHYECVGINHRQATRLTTFECDDCASKSKPPPSTMEAAALAGTRKRTRTQATAAVAASKGPATKKARAPKPKPKSSPYTASKRASRGGVAGRQAKPKAAVTAKRKARSPAAATARPKFVRAQRKSSPKPKPKKLPAPAKQKEEALKAEAGPAAAVATTPKPSAAKRKKAPSASKKDKADQLVRYSKYRKVKKRLKKKAEEVEQLQAQQSQLKEELVTSRALPSFEIGDIVSGIVGKLVEESTVALNQSLHRYTLTPPFPYIEMLLSLIDSKSRHLHSVQKDVARKPWITASIKPFFGSSFRYLFGGLLTSPVDGVTVRKTMQDSIVRSFVIVVDSSSLLEPILGKGWDRVKVPSESGQVTVQADVSSEAGKKHRIHIRFENNSFQLKYLAMCMDSKGNSVWPLEPLAAERTTE